MSPHTLLIGPAGTGKTRRCLHRYASAITHTPPREAVFLLPSAPAITAVEKDLPGTLHAGAVCTSALFTFSSLARRILSASGTPVPDLISPAAQHLLLTDIVSTTNLPFFSSSARYPGFMKVALDLIREIRQAQQSPDDLLKPLGKHGPPPDKLADIHRLYQRYREELDTLNLIDNEILLARAANRLADNPAVLAGTDLLLVDGFYRYTRVELRMIEHLLRSIPNAIVTLCYRHNDPEPFSYVDETYGALTTMAAWDEEFIDQNFRTDAPALLHIEKNVFRNGTTSIPANGAVCLMEAVDKRDEIERIASEILHLHLDERIPFGKIGILFRSIGGYAGTIRDIFRNRGIPCSIHQTSDTTVSPPVRFIFQLCDLLDGPANTERILELLKNGFSGFAPGDVDRIQEHILARGVRTEEELSSEVMGNPEENEPLRSFLDTLAALRNTISGGRPPEECAATILNLTRRFHLLERITGYAGPQRSLIRESSLSFSAAGLKALSTACGEAVEYCQATGRTEIRFTGFLDLLRTVAEHLPLHLPSPANAVHVCNVFETRSPEYEVVFVPNLVERSFPGRARNDPFLKDQERAALRRSGFDLPPRLTRISEERYLFYIACTRASKHLYLSYPLTNTDGKQLKRSHYLDETLKLVRFDSGDVHHDNTVSEIRGAVCRKDLNKLSAKSFWLSSHDTGDMNTAGSMATTIYNARACPADLGEMLCYGTRHGYKEQKPALSPRARAVVQRPDNTYTLSVTALESFAQCPFRFFCEHTLDLREPEVYEFSHLETGTAAHAALQSLYRQIYVEHRVSAENPEQVTQTGLALFKEFVHRHFGKILKAPATAAFFKRNERLFGEFLTSEAGFQTANRTTPERFELSFRPGSRSKSADPASVTKGLALDCGEDVQAVLTGRIDRVDTFQQDGITYGVVIDYKMGTEGGRVKFEDAIDLQVPVYMHALDTLFDIRPAGGFYYYIKSIRKRGIYDKRFRDLISAKIKGRQTATDTYPKDGKTEEEFRETIERTIDAVRKYVRSIHSGNISFGDTRVSNCDWCPYKDICRS